MKRPKTPVKPSTPYKPLPPNKLLRKDQFITSIPVDKYTAYTIDQFLDLIKNGSQEYDLKDIEFTFEIDTETQYYDDVITTLSVHLLTRSEIDNPNYDIMYEQYLKALKKYKQDYQKYKEKLKQYKLEMATYQVEYDKYLLDFNKKQVQRLEQRLAKLKS